MTQRDLHDLRKAVTLKLEQAKKNRSQVDSFIGLQTETISVIDEELKKKGYVDNS